VGKARVADVIATTLARRGIERVFLVTGGGAMHLNDAIGRCKALKWTCCHHEQACAMAAESYFRTSGRLAAVNVTSGPGGTNAITGIYGAWVDSLGVVVISGQVKWETLVRSTNLPLRQLGDQELDIVPMVSHITKYAVMVTEPESIRYHLERALHLATSGRPGPVWLDVPLNVQGAQVDEESLRGYDPAEDRIAWETPDLDAACREIAERLARAERPVVFVGAGIRISGAREHLLRLLARARVPVVTGWNAHDAVPDDHPSYVGRPGTIGDRSGNFAVQNADFLLVLGSRLNIRQVSYAWQGFARNAFIAMVDVDAAELKKPTLKIGLPVHADLRDCLPRLAAAVAEADGRHDAWLAWCQERRRRYPVVLPEYRATGDGPINPYAFDEVLFEALADDDAVVTGDGTACVTTFQSARIRGEQRLYTNSGCASMGYDVPGAIGACLARGGRRVICLAGDGSIQMNIQELQTIVSQGLPIKIFVLNNDGYHSIRQTQTAYFADSLIGFDPASGVSFPDFSRIASAYGFPFVRAGTLASLPAAIKATLDAPGPAMCEVMLDPAQPFAPKLSSKRLPDGRMVSAPLEDLAPFLPREELADNMIAPILTDR
jgi:acetolactate synthase-1/2/3 large subunit